VAAALYFVPYFNKKNTLMKTLLRLTLMTFLSATVFSCTKTIDKEWASPSPAQETAPSVSSKIYDYTTMPSFMNLGSPAAVLQEGSTITIFVPYGIANDKVSSATLTVKEVLFEEELGTYTLLPNTHSSAAQLVVPDELKSTTFMFATFTIDAAYAGKTVSLFSTITGSQVTSADYLLNAFSVQQ
jgi:hypothetical protein